MPLCACGYVACVYCLVKALFSRSHLPHREGPVGLVYPLIPNTHQLIGPFSSIKKSLIKFYLHIGLHFLGGV